MYILTKKLKELTNVKTFICSDELLRGLRTRKHPRDKDVFKLRATMRCRDQSKTPLARYTLRGRLFPPLSSAPPK